MKKYYSLVLIFFLASFTNAFAEWSIFLLIGQSNMAGMAATPSSIDLEELQQVRVLGFKDCSNPSRVYNEWDIASPPLHNCTEGVGPGDWFAKTLVQEGYPDTIGLVPVAISGAGIDLFRKGISYSYNYTPFENNRSGAGYDWMLTKLRKALEKGNLKGILFHQGESDCSGWGGNPTTWVSRVEDVISDIKADLNIDYDLPFIAGHLSDTENNFKQMNPYIDQLPSVIPNTLVVSSQGLLRGGDNIHFTTESQRTFGKRYAEAFLNWQKENSSSSTSISSSVTESSSSESISSSSTEMMFVRSMDLESSMWNAYVNESSLQIENISIGSTIQIMDIQGNVLLKTKASSKEYSFLMNRSGSFLLKVGNKIQRFNINK